MVNGERKPTVMSKFSAPSWYTILMVSALMLIIYNEYLEFFLLKQNQWTQAREAIQYPTESSAGNKGIPQHDPVRILFVADPQIQGYRDEPPILGYITRWDADLYLKKYFHEALRYIKPDVVITMGDLLDEGSISTDSEFEIYAERFKRLFEIPNDVKAVVVHLSGDNDIGGEGSDPLTDAKIQRFEKHFGPVTEAIHYKHVAFFKMNFLPFLHMGPTDKDRVLEQQLLKMAETSKESTVRIILSHNSMAESMLNRHIKLLRTLKPQYAFSAHTHHSGFIQHSLSKLTAMYRGIYKNENREMKDLTAGEEGFVTEEYRIPTCSYRMGVQHMAYAAAVIDPDGKIHFTLLVLPSRFKQLYRYAMFGVLMSIVLVWKILTSTRWRR